MAGSTLRPQTHLTEPAMKLGKYFTLEEMTHSQQATRKGLDNTPGPNEVKNLKELVKNVLDPLRESLNKPIVVSSGYRSPAVNKAVGGASSSQHRYGEAADITVPGMTVAQVIKAIKKLGLPYDQVIDEWGSWVHVSYGPRNRRQHLLARTVAGKTVYTPAAG